jgi:hypothetical protein
METQRDTGSWTDDRVWAAVADWRWVPPTGTRITTEEYDMIVTPGSHTMTTVYGFRETDPERVEATLDRAERTARERGAPGSRFQILPTCSPSDLADRLARRGYRELPLAEALAFELRSADGLPRLPAFSSPDGIEAREVRSDEEYAAFVALNGPLWDDPGPPPETERGLREQFHQRLKETGHSGRYVVWEGSTPVGHGGLEVVGVVGRFWGSGILPDWRGRGAYGALVRRRCEDAVANGAELALVTARTGTSGPILKRRGFRAVGPVRLFEVHW